MSTLEPPRPPSGATPEPLRPERGATAAERGPNTTELERELKTRTSMPQKLLAAASPRLYFGMVKDYPAGIKQFLWLCLGILYPFWLIGVAVAWPIVIVAKGVGRVLFEIWWFLTGWFWKRLGGEKPTRDKMKQMDEERQAKTDALRTERHE